MISAALLACALASAGARAAAQSCHAPPLREPTSTGLRLSYTQLFATFEDEAGAGEYQGAIAMLAWNHPVVSVELTLPAYRLVQETEAVGLGDVAVDVRVALLRSSTDELRAGLELAASLPTGDADRQLGMGHTMLMPRVWARFASRPFNALLQLGYGAALNGNEHTSSHSHLHAGHTASGSAFPRVNPMNSSELEHALGASLEVHEHVNVTGRWLGAIALEADGVTRQIVAPGLHFAVERLEATLELQLPLAGDPFDFKLLASIGSSL